METVKSSCALPYEAVSSYYTATGELPQHKKICELKLK